MRRGRGSWNSTQQVAAMPPSGDSGGQFQRRSAVLPCTIAMLERLPAAAAAAATDTLRPWKPLLMGSIPQIDAAAGRNVAYQNIETHSSATVIR